MNERELRGALLKKLSIPSLMSQRELAAWVAKAFPESLQSTLLHRPPSDGPTPEGLHNLRLDLPRLGVRLPMPVQATDRYQYHIVL